MVVPQTLCDITIIEGPFVTDRNEWCKEAEYIASTSDTQEAQTGISLGLLSRAGRPADDAKRWSNKTWPICWNC